MLPITASVEIKVIFHMTCSCSYGECPFIYSRVPFCLRYCKKRVTWCQNKNQQVDITYLFFWIVCLTVINRNSYFFHYSGNVFCRGFIHNFHALEYLSFNKLSLKSPSFQLILWSWRQNICSFMRFTDLWNYLFNEMEIFHFYSRLLKTNIFLYDSFY